MPDPLVPLAKDWLPRLVKEWARIRADRKAELDRIFLELGDYEQLAKTYVESDGQTGNAADYDEDEPRRRTVLLLDALDEDRAAFGHIEERIEELLRESRSFRQVIASRASSATSRRPLRWPGTCRSKS